MNFIMLVQNFEGSPQNSFRGQKHPKFGTILDNFKVWRQISRRDEDIQNRTSTWFTAISPMLGEKSTMNFGPLIMEI